MLVSLDVVYNSGLAKKPNSLCMVKEYNSFLWTQNYRLLLIMACICPNVRDYEAKDAEEASQCWQDLHPQTPRSHTGSARRNRQLECWAIYLTHFFQAYEMVLNCKHLLQNWRSTNDRQSLRKWFMTWLYSIYVLGSIPILVDLTGDAQWILRMTVVRCRIC